MTLAQYQHSRGLWLRHLRALRFYHRDSADFHTLRRYAQNNMLAERRMYRATVTKATEATEAR